MGDVDEDHHDRTLNISRADIIYTYFITYNNRLRY